MFEIREYETKSAHSYFGEWFDRLDSGTAARVDKYIRRLESGNFGSSKSVGEGVYELKIDLGPGYRVYYGRDGKTLIILLGGGSKKRQSTDIAAAQKRWESYKKAKKDGTHTTL